MTIYILFLIVAVCGPILHLMINREPRTHKQTFEVIIRYAVFAFIGLNGINDAIMLAFFPDQVALMLGWPAGNPFEYIAACANFAFGVIGILCLRQTPGFFMAVIIGQAVFLLSAAFGRYKALLAHQGLATPLMQGMYADIIIPVLMLTLLFTYFAIFRNKNNI